MERVAIKRIEKAIWVSQRQVIAYSGGKDSLVVAHLCKQLGITDAVCEISFYFQEQLNNIRGIAKGLGLNVHWRDSLTLEWLRKHQDIIFSDDTRKRGWSFQVRQQKTVKAVAREYNYDCQIFGRRREENTVPSPLYRTRAGLQCHPIYDWSTHDVWNYIRKHELPIPWIYGTAFGKYEGNAPFYTMRASDHGGEEECWKLAEKLDERYSKARILG